MVIDDVAMVGLRMAAVTKLVGRVLVEFELTDDERGAVGDLLELISHRLADVSVKHFSN